VPGDREDIEVFRHTNRVVVKIQRSNYSYQLSEPVNLLTYRQSTQWHETVIAGPVPNCAGNRGNSFPGIYCYNPAGNAEWVVMVDGPVDWSECKLGVSPLADALELGLFSTGAIDPQVSLKLWHSTPSDSPSQWNALETLVAKSFALLPLPARPDYTPDWVELASACLAGLSSQGQHSLAQQLGGVAYHSMLDERKSPYAQPKPYIELIPQVSIARALHRAMQKTPVEDASGISQKLVERVIPQFFNSELSVFENTYSGQMRTHQKRAPRVSRKKAQGSRRSHNVVLETWYALSNLSDILYLCEAFPAADLRELAIESVSAWIEIGKEIGYIFPLFLNVTTRESHGGNLNVAAGGLYADVMLSAARILPHRAEELKTEAAHALTVLRRFPVQQLFHQPEQLARAAESAFLLGVADNSYEKMGHDFVNALLLMMYRDPINAGLFEGCAGMMYPTFRESVASLVTLAALPDRVRELPIRDICESGLSRSYRFLKHYDARTALPGEGLGTKEMPNAGYIGTALYAAGGVFDLAYMQKTLM
jgi:hypothetical protein